MHRRRTSASKDPSRVRAMTVIALTVAWAAVEAVDTLHIDALVVPPFYVERHTVVSDDYFLSLFRLRLRGGNESAARVPVILHHGFAFSANVWFLLPREQGLSYILYDAGYDVWAISDRGSTHSRRHKTLSPAQRAFWRFTMDDLALKDLPAIVAYVKTATGRSSVGTVAYSMGGTQTFMLGAERPSPSPFCHHVAVTPVVFPQRMATPIVRALLVSNIDRVLQHWDAQRVVPAGLGALFGGLCAAPPYARAADLVCDVTIIGAFGQPTFVTPQELERFEAIAWPSSMAAGPPAQYAQSWRRSPNGPVLVKFDYGRMCGPKSGGDRTCNRQVYGSDVPPEYDIRRYSIPTTIIAGGKDLVSVAWDRDNVAARLPPSVLRRTVVLPEHTHLDVAWHDARKYSSFVIEGLQSSCST